ncbi:recombinase family protein [Micrococcus antarcticus]|uniref:recombinase family protein n=1 Tax=Micrococcus antarcticus TaxID=86171 RepID=UPI00384EB815
MRAREYLRVSRDASGEGRSPSEQHAENAAAVADQGWDLHPEPYREDRAVSASRYARGKARPAFEQLRADLAAGTFDADVLVLWEASRGGRRVGEWADLVDALEAARVLVYVTSEDAAHDPAKPGGRRALLSAAVDSEHESGKTSVRIRRTVRARAEAGGVHGKNLWGYVRRYGRSSSGHPVLEAVEPDPATAPIVRDVFERVAAGDASWAVARDLNHAGVPTRRPARTAGRAQIGWTQRMVVQLVRTEAYAGVRVHRDPETGEVRRTPAVWPALVDRATWDRAQDVLAARGAAGRRDADWAATHLLTGILRCVCGAPMRTGRQNSGGGARYVTYACPATPGGQPGPHTSMREVHADALVVEAVLNTLADPAFLARVGSEQGETDTRREELRSEIAAAETYLAEAKAASAAALDLSILLEARDAVAPRLEAARRELELLAGVSPEVAALAGREDLDDVWESMDVAAQRRVLRAVVRPVVLPAVPGRRGLAAARDRLELVWR